MSLPETQLIINKVDALETRVAELNVMLGKLVPILSNSAALIGFIEGKHDIRDKKFECNYLQRLSDALDKLQE